MRILFWLAAAMGVCFRVLSVFGLVCCVAARCVAGRCSLRGAPTGKILRRRPRSGCGAERARSPAGRAAVPHALPAGPSSLIGLPMARAATDYVRLGTRVLLDDLADHARADRAAALSDGETQPLVHGDRLDQLDLHLDVVAGHDHLDAVGQLGHPGDVSCAEVELRPVAGEEGGVTATLLLLQDVD